MKLFLAAVALLCSPAAAVIKTFKDILTNASINAEFTSTNFSFLDGPKLGYPGPANDTSYDWYATRMITAFALHILVLTFTHCRWYFDVVSDSSNASVAVVFYNSGPDGFINTYLGGPLSVSIIGTFANGTVFDLSAPASAAEIRYGPDEGISLEYVNSGFSFTGSNVNQDNVEYAINIDSPAIGLKGSIKYHAVSMIRTSPLPGLDS